MYIDLLKDSELTDVDIQIAATSLIDLRTVKTQQDSVALMENLLKDPKCPGDLIIFHPKATLFYTPNLDPHKEGFCLWNNYINVVEMVTLQNFILRKANILLDQALSPNPNSGEFADCASFLEGLGNSHQYLRGGHKRLYREIDKKLKQTKTTEKFFDLLGSYKIYQAYKIIIQQIQIIQNTLIKIKQVAGAIGFNQIGILLVDVLLENASDLEQSLLTHSNALRAIEDRKRRGVILPSDPQDEINTKIAVSSEILTYTRELLPHYEHIIEELLNSEEKANIDTSIARTKLNESKNFKLVSNSTYSYDTAPILVKENREYIEALLKTATGGLKDFLDLFHIFCQSLHSDKKSVLEIEN